MTSDDKSAGTKRALGAVVVTVAAMALAPVSRALPALYASTKVDFTGSGTTQAMGLNNSAQVIDTYGDGPGFVLCRWPETTRRMMRGSALCRYIS